MENGWLTMENPNLKWMIWGYPHLRKPPFTTYSLSYPSCSGYSYRATMFRKFGVTFQLISSFDCFKWWGVEVRGSRGIKSDERNIENHQDVSFLVKKFTRQTSFRNYDAPLIFPMLRSCVSTWFQNAINR